MNSPKEILLHLSLIKGIGPRTIQKICESSLVLQSLYTLSVHDIAASLGVSLKLAKQISTGLSDRALLNKELDLLEKHSDITIMCRVDKEYPELLSHIACPPPILYVRGRLGDTHKMFACVGSRKAKLYARTFFQQTIPDLVSAGWTIVSGGAYGADTMAHEAALQAGGYTVSVLGSGLLRPYPHQNKRLFERIVEGGGGIVSSFPLSTEPAAGNFPARNHIISGLSAGCLVVQAAQKSGALITAYAALDQGRHVFALPGLFDEELSAGCHYLIRQGASLTTSSSDILDELDPLCNARGRFQTAKMPLLQLNKAEQAFFDQCSIPTSINELVEKMGVSLHEVMTIACKLQLQGSIKQHPATGLWEKAY